MTEPADSHADHHEAARALSATTPPGELDQVLARFAAEQQILVALDFDGCLAPFVLDPADARPLPAAMAALTDLASRPGVHLALISGRPVADLHHLATPPPGTHLVGSHGAETAGVDASGGLVLTPLRLSEDQASLLAEVTSAVEQIASDYPGAWIEHKPASAVVHTRGLTTAQAEHALTAAIQGPGSWPGVSPMRGNQVAELAVLDATKGDSLRALRGQLAPGDTALGVLYAGDDVTDETAMAILEPSDLGLKVGAAETLARYRVADEEAVAEMLARLAMWRRSRQA